MNKRGELVQKVMVVLVLFIVLSVIICAVWIASIAGPPVVGVGLQAVGQIRGSINGNPDAQNNLQNASAPALNMAQGILGAAEIGVYLFFLAYVLGFIAICYFVRTYRFLAVIWIGLVIFTVIIAMVLSNAYQTAAADGATASFYQAWGTNDFLMRFLPHIFAAIGIGGGIFIFVLVTIEPEESSDSEI